jgi:hypothetical protein
MLLISPRGNRRLILSNAVKERRVAGKRTRVDVVHAAGINQLPEIKLLAVLEERLGTQDVALCRDAVQRVTDQDKLHRLVRLAAHCEDIDVFQRGLRKR